MSLVKDSQTESCASGSPNTPTTLFAKQWAGGAVQPGDAFRVTARLRAPFSQDASFEVRLGNVLLYQGSLAAGADEILVILGWREAGPRAGFAGGWRLNSGPVDYASTTFNWSSSMTLTVVGESAELGGAILENVFVER